VGKLLVAARPQEPVVGNIVRRVLGVIREEDEARGESDMSSMGSETGSLPQTPQTEASPFISSLSPSGITPRRDISEPFSGNRPSLLSQNTSPPGRPQPTSMFSIMAHPTMASPGTSSPAGRSGTVTPSMGASFSAGTDFREEVTQGILEIIDELEQSDEQIASYALEHIHPSEVIFTYSASLTVQRFLLKAASKRKFTLIHAEAYPNNHRKSHALATGRIDEDDELDAKSFQKRLTSAGITVILIPDSAIFAVMSRVNKAILGAHAILSNGSIVAVAGTKTIAEAARVHHVPVLVLAGTYKLSPIYPHNPSIFVQYGNVEEVIKYQDGGMRQPNIDVSNPIYEIVDSSAIDLFVTNVGAVAGGYLYREVRGQYRDEDVEL
jgi:translation initiation factor eIF-2B subunit beta